MNRRRNQNRSGPDFVRFFQPILNALRENDASARPKEVYDWIIENLDISDEELQRTNKNGRSNFENKVAFARFYLVKSGYLDGKTRGVWALTEKGRSIDITPELALQIFDEVQEKNFSKQARDSASQVAESAPDDDSLLSEDGEDDSEYLNIDEVREVLLSHIRRMSAKGFEEFCARLLRSMGLENVKTQGGAGDRGIDGTGELLVNRFLRTRVAFQCKKYGDANSITPEKIRDFRGAISGRVDRGIFITTSRFTKAALEEAQRENVIPIEIVDVSRLLDLVIEEKFGVSEAIALRLDERFFSQYE
jgi:restriction system protein